MAPSQLSVLCAFLSALRHEPHANHTSLLDWLHSTNWHRMKFRAGNGETLAFSMNRLQISVTAVKVNWDWKLFYYCHVSWMFLLFGKLPWLASEGMQREGDHLTLRKSYSRLQIDVSLNWSPELPGQLENSWTGRSSRHPKSCMEGKNKFQLWDIWRGELNAQVCVGTTSISVSYLEVTDLYDWKKKLWTESCISEICLQTSSIFLAVLC